MSMTNRRARDRADIVLGEDWDRPAGTVESELRAARQRRSMFTLNRSPLARKIIMFNLLAIVILVAGVMYLNPFRDSLVHQRERALAVEAQLDRRHLRGQPAAQRAREPLTGDGIDPVDVLTASASPMGSTSSSSPIPTRSWPRPSMAAGPTRPVRGLAPQEDERLLITISSTPSGRPVQPRRIGPDGPAAGHARKPRAVDGHAASEGATVLRRSNGVTGAAFAAATPIEGPNGQVGVLVVTTAAGEIDQLVRGEREELLQMFVVALFVSIGLSFVLASTIANPLSDLAAAAELGRDKNARKMSPTRVRIPDLTGRPDEIGRLSGALRGMVSALYDRIDANEQFAADVSHEIKNPLASLRSAVGTMRVARTDDQRNRLLEVIEHDVQRLDRLVSDISNASRLDSELVKEEEEEFDLVRTLENLSQYHGEEAEKKGVDFITDLPPEPIRISGLEGRLAQVFVNLLSNAISFCEEGDAVRLWTRRRANRVLIVVEDTGPGIPEEALTKVFNRFYSERPVKQFGNHSGLGLAISKQIVEAHGGVIWAENIRPTDLDIVSEPLGARFVVGLPI
jgi:two-component system sensor histidine kinase ChvG